MVAGPASRATVIEFEEGHAHVSVTFALGAARCFVAPLLALLRDELAGVQEVCGRSGVPRAGRRHADRIPPVPGEWAKPSAVPISRRCRMKNGVPNGPGSGLSRPRLPVMGASRPSR